MLVIDLPIRKIAECTEVFLLHCSFRELLYIKSLVTTTNVQFCYLCILSITYYLTVTCFGIVTIFKELTPIFHYNIQQYVIYKKQVFLLVSIVQFWLKLYCIICVFL